MAKLADALDLGSSALRRGGSSPFTRTIEDLFEYPNFKYMNQSEMIDFFVFWKNHRKGLPMVNIIKEEIEIEESLESRLRVICDFCNTTPIIENGSIRRIDKTNLTYIEPHRIYIKNNLYLVFNYSSEIYVNNLGKKIKLSELEDYIK